MSKSIKFTLISVMVIAITFAFFGICFAAGTNISYAADEQVIYSCEDSDGTSFVVTILDETTCSVVYGDKSATLTYAVNGPVLTLNNITTGVSVKFTIGEGNKLSAYSGSSILSELNNIADSDLSEETVSNTITNKVSETLSKYLSDNWVVNIVSWSIDVGLVGFIAGVYLKYRKYKNTTMGELEELAEKKIAEVIKSKFGDLQGEVGDKVADSLKVLDNVDETMTLLLKAFILAQDKTADGRLAMLNLLQGQTEDKEVEEKIEELKEEITETQEAVDEVVSKVEGEYADIF